MHLTLDSTLKVDGSHWNGELIVIQHFTHCQGRAAGLPHQTKLLRKMIQSLRSWSKPISINAILACIRPADLLPLWRRVTNRLSFGLYSKDCNFSIGLHAGSCVHATVTFAILQKLLPWFFAFYVTINLLLLLICLNLKESRSRYQVLNRLLFKVVLNGECIICLLEKVFWLKEGIYGKWVLT